MKYKKAKRLLSLGVMTVFVLSLLAGCGGDSGTKPEATEGNTEEVQDAQEATDASDSADGDAETITMWGWNAGDIDKIFAAYKEKTGADVELEYVTVQQEESFQKLQTTISAGQSIVLCRGIHPIVANWPPTSFLMRLSSSVSSLHAITLKWARTEVSP